MKFTKMQGIGNDYIYVDCTKEQITDPGALAKKLSDRHYGIGGDGMILICPSEVADFRMDMYNDDGSQGKMCGNGIRCVGKFVHDKGLTDKTTVTVETLSGIKTLKLRLDENGNVKTVRVDMGVPEMEPAKIPVKLDGDYVVDRKVDLAGGEYNITCVSMGNPHCVIFTDNIDSLDLEKIGSKFENDPLFPEKVNTEFVEASTSGEIKMRVWERGSGETLACGTGACAVFVAAALNGYLSDRMGVVHLRGGDLTIEWAGDNHVYMTGAAEFVFDGEIEI